MSVDDAPGKDFSRLFDVDVPNVLDLRYSLAQRRAIGAPRPENVVAQIVRWRAELARTGDSIVHARF